MRDSRIRVMLFYWGRRGLSRFALQAAQAAIANSRFSAKICVSKQNDNYSSFESLGAAVIPVDTFSNNAGAIFEAWKLPLIRAELAKRIAEHKPEVIIELMPHAWSSLIFPMIKSQSARYATIIHDADPHPGDYRSASLQWLFRRTLQQADVILTLSGSVAGKIEATGIVSHRKIFSLFHPDLDFGTRRGLKPPSQGEPWRLAFFGRIMPYKGLDLFVDMVDDLRDQGIAVKPAIYGEGVLNSRIARKLSSFDAEVINRWLGEAEIGELLQKTHAVILSHVEASQSGVAAAAFGAGVPVVATPVGGLVEQIADGVTGILAARADSIALSQAVQVLMRNPELYVAIQRNLDATRAERSFTRFVNDCVSHALHAGAS